MKAKIIVTFGPAIMDEKILLEIRKLGVRNFRLNSAHIKTSDIGEYMNKLNSVYEERNEYSVMIDLKGPELRTGDFPSNTYKFEDGKEYCIGEGCEIRLNNESILKDLKKGNSIYLSDGKVRLIVTETGTNKIFAKAVQAGVIRSKSRVNIPDVKLKLGSLTDRDIEFIESGINSEVDFFALSFVQDEEDVKNLRNVINDKNGRQLIISKIETLSGVKNSISISKFSDFVMIARGDLGVELPISEVAVLQKRITQEAKKIGRQVILATQILESMVSNEEPTRAEISDITNAIYDGVDSFLLTDETAIGIHPVEAVEYLIQTIDYSEKYSNLNIEIENSFSNPISFAVAKSAKIMSDNLGYDIMAFTKNGNTIRVLSSLRVKNKIYGITYDPMIYRWMHLYHNINPVLVKLDEKKRIADYLSDLKEKLNIPNGKKFIIVSGEDYFVFGGTNDVKVHLIGEFIGRGNYNGKTICGEFGKDIIIYEGGKIINNAKVVIFEYAPSFSLIDNLRKSGIFVCTNFNFIKKPENGKKVCLDNESGILYYQ